MKRTIVVTLVATALTVLMFTFGIAIMIGNTDFGKVVTGHGETVVDPWKSFQSGPSTLFWYLDLPIILVVGSLAATLAKRFSIGSAVIATSPLAVAQFLMGNWGKALILIVFAVIIALLSVWRREKIRIAFQQED